jgi:uncharacterized protein
LFARGEGIHFDRGEMFFACTSGGDAKAGQIFRYRPARDEGRSARGGTIELFFESPEAAIMDYADNLTVAPWGHLIICEDRSGSGKENHLRGVAPDGRAYLLARLRLDTELAGACFAPDGRTLFVNIYSPGQTVAITGPWLKFAS